MIKIILKIKELVLKFRFWFFILVLINAIPILIYQYYPTLDGPSHLYNVNLLKEILISKNEHVQQFFTLNTEIVPNWTSHFILLLLRLVFSPVLSNKIFLLLIAIGLPLTIFNFITRINPQNQLLTVFSLPFVYTYLFGLGFYNYCLSILLLFIGLNYWINNKVNRLLLKIPVMFILVTLLYFTHIYLYVSLIIAAFCYTTYRLISQYILHDPAFKKSLIDLLLLIAISLPTIVLLYIFMSIREFPSLDKRLPFLDLIKNIVNVRPLIVHDYISKVKYTRILFYLVILLFAYSTFKFSLELKHLQIKQLLQSKRTYLFIITLIFMTLFLIYSDPVNDGGYIPVRLSTILFLFLFCWLSTLNYPNFIKIISFITILIINFKILSIEHKSLSEEDNLIKKFIEASALIDENSTILPVRNLDRMLDGHYSNFLGLNKPVVILENYEATTPHFPLTWNSVELPKINLGDTIVTDLCLYNKFPANSHNESIVDYAIIWGDDEMNECKSGLVNIIEKNYDLIYYSGKPTVKLFKIKSKFVDARYKITPSIY